jgi:hypothetical protein
VLNGVGAERLSCEECGREQADGERGWKAYRTFEEDESPETHVFCPECAAREFG